MAAKRSRTDRTQKRCHTAKTNINGNAPRQIVGEQTTGKSYSQSTFELSDGSALALSTQQYYTPNGVDLAKNGVIPDIVVELSMEELYSMFVVPHNEDRQLMTAVEALTAK